MSVFGGIIFSTASLFAGDTNPPGNFITTRTIYVPDISHSNVPLPDGVLAWDGTSKATDAGADQEQANFTFNFTNVAKRIDISLVTNVITSTNSIILTNVTAITNFTPIAVTILAVHPSCGCTTSKLPSSLPWTIPPGTNGQFDLSVNLEGKSGTLYKTVEVSTDKGKKTLMLRINILPPVIPTMNDADRALALAAAKVDRQAVFHGDCATCHVKPGQRKYGKALYDADCGICHEAENRATMVPDLHALKVPTNADFWSTWLAHGKAGSLMPAFSASDGGPLSDMQIASLASFLSQAIPSKVPPAAQ